MAGISITNATRGTVPRRAFFRIKEKILGKRYELSVVVVDARTMRTHNRTHHKKNMPTDVLAFPLSSTSGEILFHLPTVRKKAKLFSLTERDYLAYLFIHGSLHLKGHTHGRTMEKLEDTWCTTFGIAIPNR